MYQECPTDHILGIFYYAAPLRICCMNIPCRTSRTHSPVSRLMNPAQGPIATPLLSFLFRFCFRNRSCWGAETHKLLLQMSPDKAPYFSRRFLLIRSCGSATSQTQILQQRPDRRPAKCGESPKPNSNSNSNVVPHCWCGLA